MFVCVNRNKYSKAKKRMEKNVFGLNLNLVQTFSIIVCGIPFYLIFVPFEYYMSYLFCLQQYTASSLSFVLIHSHSHTHTHTFCFVALVYIPFNLIATFVIATVVQHLCVSYVMRICHKFEKHEDIMFSHFVSFSSIYCYWYYRCWILSSLLLLFFFLFNFSILFLFLFCLLACLPLVLLLSTPW